MKGTIEMGLFKIYKQLVAHAPIKNPAIALSSFHIVIITQLSRIVMRYSEKRKLIFVSSVVLQICPLSTTLVFHPLP